MPEEILEHLVAFLLRQLVDAHRVAGIAIEHFLAGERMPQEDRMRYRRLRFALRVSEWRPLAAFLPSHHFPELVEVVQHGRAFELALDVARQASVRRLRVRELRRAERRAVALRDLDAVEHVGERDHPAVGHVGVPALPGIGEADRPAVLDDVREDHHLRHAGLLVALRADVDLEVAKLPAEIGELAPGELLPRKAHHAAPAERLEDAVDLGGWQRPGEVEPFDARAQCFAARDDFHLGSLTNPASGIPSASACKRRASLAARRCATASTSAARASGTKHTPHSSASTRSPGVTSMPAICTGSLTAMVSMRHLPVIGLTPADQIG